MNQQDDEEKRVEFMTEVLKIYLSCVAISTAIVQNHRYSPYEKTEAAMKMAVPMATQFVAYYIAEQLILQSGVNKWLPLNIWLFFKVTRLNLYFTAMSYTFTMYMVFEGKPALLDPIGQLIDMRRVRERNDTSNWTYYDYFFMGCQYQSGSSTRSGVRSLRTVEIGFDPRESMVSKMIWVAETFVSDLVPESKPDNIFFSLGLAVLRFFGITGTITCIQVLVAQIISLMVGFLPADIMFISAIDASLVEPNNEIQPLESIVIKNYLTKNGSLCSADAWKNYVHVRWGQTSRNNVNELANYIAAMKMGRKFIYFIDYYFQEWKMSQPPEKHDRFNDEYLEHLNSQYWFDQLATFKQYKAEALTDIQNNIDETLLNLANIDVRAWQALGLETNEITTLKNSGATGMISYDVFDRAIGINRVTGQTNELVVNRIREQAQFVPFFNCASESVSKTHPCCQAVPSYNSALPDDGNVTYYWKTAGSYQETYISRFGDSSDFSRPK